MMFFLILDYLDFMDIDSKISWRFWSSPRLYVKALVLRLKLCWELSIINVRIPNPLLGAWGYCGGLKVIFKLLSL
jgi:hypothetical protein